MSNRIWELDMSFIASDAEMVPPPPPFAYTAKTARGWTKLLCSACVVDDPEADYRVADHYGTPEPISREDAEGMMEGQALTCDSCGQNVQNVQAPRMEPELCGKSADWLYAELDAIRNTKSESHSAECRIRVVIAFEQLQVEVATLRAQLKQVSVVSPQ